MDEISTRENGFEEFAFTGQRNKIWHGKGQQMEEDRPLEEWRVQAGMDWEVRESPVEFRPLELHSLQGIANITFPDRKVLYRSDTLAPLSIVSNDFKVVQPVEVIEFFRNLIESHGMKMSTAGCLFGGKRFWALADTGNVGNVIPNDRIRSYLFFVTSVDGTLASMARFVSVRVICNNTMQIALREGQTETKNVVRKTHRSVWNTTQAQIDLGLLSESFESFMTDLRTLANRKMSLKEAGEFFKKSCYDPEKEESDQSRSDRKKVEDLLDIYTYGIGAVPGTAYGVFNAVTNYYTYGTGRRSVDSQFWTAWGVDSKEKDKAFQELLEIC